MKKILSGALLLFIVGVGSCKKEFELLEFSVLDSPTVVVPKTLSPGRLVTLPPLAVASTSGATYSRNGTATDFVQAVTLDTLRLTITSPAGRNFNFLRRIQLFISTAPDDEPLLLDSPNQVPPNATSITLTPSSQKLDLYLRQSAYTLIAKVQTDSALTQDVTIRVDAQFTVKARKL